jgi:hypothetical protein
MPAGTLCVDIFHRRAFEFQELLQFVLAIAAWRNAIQDRVDRVGHEGAAVARECGVVEEGLAGAQAIVQLADQLPVLRVVDEDQSGLPPGDDEPFLGKEHSGRHHASVRARGREHFNF